MKPVNKKGESFTLTVSLLSLHLITGLELLVAAESSDRHSRL